MHGRVGPWGEEGMCRTVEMSDAQKKTCGFLESSNPCRAYQCTPSAKPFAPMTVAAIVVAPAKLQPFPIVIGAMIPSLLQDLRDIEPSIQTGITRRCTPGRHGGYNDKQNNTLEHGLSASLATMSPVQRMLCRERRGGRSMWYHGRGAGAWSWWG